MKCYQFLLLSLLLLHFFIFFIYLLLFLFYFHFIYFFIILFFIFFTFFIIIIAFFLTEAGLNMDNELTLFVHLQKFTFMCLIWSQGDHALPIFF